jgi:hypothetical protein
MMILEGSTKSVVWKMQLLAAAAGSQPGHGANALATDVSRKLLEHVDFLCQNAFSNVRILSASCQT